MSDPLEPLSARAYFDRKFPGLTMQRAHSKTEIAYSTIHRHVRDGAPVSRDTAVELQNWSLRPEVIAVTGGAYISAALTLELVDPLAPTGSDAR